MTEDTANDRVVIIEIEEELRDVKTHVLIIVITFILGLIGASFVGFFAAIAGAMGGRMDLGLLWLANYTVAGGSAGASLAGLLALSCGKNLGRGFSQVFTICLSCLTAMLFRDILDGCGLHCDEDLFTGVWSAWILLLGVFGGLLLTANIRGYHRWSGMLAATGVVLMLVIGALVLSPRTDFIDDSGFVIMMVIYALLGGVSGAIVGAIRDRLAREQSTTTPAVDTAYDGV